MAKKKTGWKAMRQTTTKAFKEKPMRSSAKSILAGAVLFGLGYLAFPVIGLHRGVGWTVRGINDAVNFDDVVFPEGKLNNRRVEYVREEGLFGENYRMREWRTAKDYHDFIDLDSVPLGQEAKLEKIVVKRRGSEYEFERTGKEGAHSYSVNGKVRDDESEVRDAIDYLFEKGDERYNLNRASMLNIEVTGIASAKSTEASLYRAVADEFEAK
jgi:hypothetical protein